MKACCKTPKFNMFDLVYVFGSDQSKVFKIRSIRYEESIDEFVYNVSCHLSSYREDELIKAAPEFAIGDTLKNLEITNVRYNDKIYEFEYEVCGEFRTFSGVKALAEATRPRRGLIVRNGYSQGIILCVNIQAQMYCVLWENGNLSPYVPFDADYITFTSMVYGSYSNDTLYSPSFEKAYNDIINRQHID